MTSEDIKRIVHLVQEATDNLISVNNDNEPDYIRSAAQVRFKQSWTFANELLKNDGLQIYIQKGTASAGPLPQED